MTSLERAINSGYPFLTLKPPKKFNTCTTFCSMYWYVSIYSEECFWTQYMYPKLSPFNGFRWCPLGKLSHLGLEQLNDSHSVILGKENFSRSPRDFTAEGLDSINRHYRLDGKVERSRNMGATRHLKSLLCWFTCAHGRRMWQKRKVGRTNINNGVGLHYNHSCIILWICVRLYWFMDTMSPPLLISSISDFSIVGKSIINSEEFLLLPWVLETSCSFIYGPSLSLLMCLPPFSILLQLLCPLFVLVFFLLSLSHALPTLISALLENLTLHCCYCILECNNDIHIRQLCCTIYIYACNRRSEKGTIWWTKINPHFLALKQLLL